MVRGFWLAAGMLGLACGGISSHRVDEDDQGNSGATQGGSRSPGPGGTTAGKITGTSGGATSTPAGGSVSTQPGGGSSAVATGGSGTTPSGGATPGGSPPVTMPTQPAACYNDDDCPGAACGGDVCNWNKIHPSPIPEGDRFYVCNPAGSSPQGMDGWCTTDADCKCRGLGAVCRVPYCTFTRASDAPKP